MNFCEDCTYNDEQYCILFDDVLSYEDCIFHKEANDE